MVLITGATGKQGGAVVDALLESPQAEQFTILAVTRNPESPSAQKLKSRGVKVITGDLNDVPSLFQNAKTVVNQPIWGVFSVQIPAGKGATVHTEEAQGKALVDGAVANEVKMFVYTSVDRGGDEKSPDNATPIPHFISKYNVEKHLMEKAKDTGMDWCILRPVAFMDVGSSLLFCQDVGMIANVCRTSHRTSWARVLRQCGKWVSKRSAYNSLL